MEFIIAFFIGVWLLALTLATYIMIKEQLQFKRGHNPFARICRKCGAHQHQYETRVEGFRPTTWWEEVYPIGNDPNCSCHKYARQT